MANGGWYGTKEEWDRIEAPLKTLDRELKKFAAERGLIVTGNHKDWPERSMTWGEAVRCLIQVYLDDRSKLTFNVWVCVSEDRDGARYWRQEMLRKSSPISDIQPNFSRLLENAREKAEFWRQHPEMLELATTLKE